MGRLALLLTATMFVISASPLSAQLKLEDIEATAAPESERIQQLMSALENPDPNYRMHAFQTIVRKGSDYERRLALQRAFLGTDINLRNAALKQRLSEMPVLRVEIARPEAESDGIDRHFGPRPSAWVELSLVAQDLKTGLFLVNNEEAFVVNDQFLISFWPGNLIGTCVVEFGLSDELSLAGQLNCDKIPLTTARAPLF
jgi:hypothetical protein